jgi:hypothetical protein
MTCPDFIFSKRGRAGIGVIQPQSGLDYPFVSPAGPAPNAENDIRYQLADFHLSFDDAGDYNPAVAPVRYPLRVKYLYGVGCVENTPPAGFFTPQHAADVLVVDANNRTVFDTTTSGITFSTKAWGADYRIYEWKNGDAVCRAVAYTTWPSTDNSTSDEDTPRNYPKYLAAANAILDNRAVYKLPKRLLSLRTRNGQTTSPRYKNKFTFLNGYNTTLSAAATTSNNLRVNTPITFAVVAGSGKGKFGNCGDVPTVYPIARINGTPAEKGHYLMAAKDCLWVRRPTNATKNGAGEITAVTPSTTAGLQVGADCDPCCGCEDYADTAKYMNSTSYRYKLIGQRAGEVRDEHENNIARWLDYRACSIQQPLRLLLVPQRCPYIDIAMMLCNTCDGKCFGDSVLTLNLSVTSSASTTVELECGHTALYAPNINGQAVGITQSNGGLQYSAALPSLKSGESAYVQFRVKITQPEPEDPTKQGKARGPYPITGVLTGTINGEPILTNCGELLGDDEPPLAASAEVTQILYCNSQGQTEAPC